MFWLDKTNKHTVISEVDAQFLKYYLGQVYAKQFN